MLLPQLILQCLLLLLALLPNFLTLKVDVLSDETWAHGFANQSWVLGGALWSIHKHAIFAQVVHDHVLEFDLAHFTSSKKRPYLLKRLLRGHWSLLISHSFISHWVSKRVLHAFLHCFFALIFSLFRNFVIKLFVEPCVDFAFCLAMNSVKLWNEALFEDLIQFVGVLWTIIGI